MGAVLDSEDFGFPSSSITGSSTSNSVGVTKPGGVGRKTEPQSAVVDIPSFEDLLIQAGLDDDEGDSGQGRSSPFGTNFSHELDLLLAETNKSSIMYARGENDGKMQVRQSKSAFSSYKSTESPMGNLVTPSTAVVFPSKGISGPARSADGKRPVLRLAVEGGPRGGMAWLDDVQSIIAATQEALLAETEG